MARPAHQREPSTEEVSRLMPTHTQRAPVSPVILVARRLNDDS